MKFTKLFALLVASTLATVLSASAQHLDTPDSPSSTASRPGISSRASHLVVPQTGAWHLSSRQSHATSVSGRRSARANQLLVERVLARVDILERVATTQLEIQLTNHGGTQAEGVVLLPVPPNAAVSSFDFDGTGAEPSARILPAEEARATYDEIVRELLDPALLEFAGYNLLRSSVFPVPAGGKQRLRITYTHVCEVEGDRVDYVLPRSESLSSTTPWEIQVTLRGRTSVGAIYSPSHELTEPDRPKSTVGPTRVYLAPSSSRTPGPFRLSWLTEPRQGANEVQATLFSYPDPTLGGGYFLLMAGVPARISDANQTPQREVTLVIDRSGSMRGGKLDQAKAAALQVIEGLEDGERFNLIDYSNQVAMFSAKPVIKDARQIELARKYLATLLPTGGTNIRDALVEALSQESSEGTVPIVLFLTDGIPTVGVRAEGVIGESARKANRSNRRIFTFGVGADVNAPLLDRISEDSRGFTTYVDPGQDVELAVHGVFRRLHGPVLSEPTMWLTDENGEIDTRRVRELCPARLPDLYEGGTTLLLGQYRGDDPLRFRIRGEFLGTEREFAFEFALDKSTTRNSFVPRLWATRRIAFLAEEIRQAGSALSAAEIAGRHDLMAEARYAELGEEILRLSTTFGVLSEYTSFLALEGTDLGDWGALVASNNMHFNDRAVLDRSGAGAVNQGKNFQYQKAQSCLNVSNGMWNAANERVEFTSVQQVCDLAFFNRQGKWIDARLLGAEAQTEIQEKPDETVLIGSPRHLEIVHAFAAEGRQGALALEGQILVQHSGQNILVCNDLSDIPPSQNTSVQLDNSSQEQENSQ